MIHPAQWLTDLPPVTWFLLKSTALLTVVWLIHMASGPCNPRWRVLLWRCTAVGLVMLPAAQWTGPSLEIVVHPVVAAPAPSAPPMPPGPPLPREMGTFRSLPDSAIQRVMPESRVVEPSFSMWGWSQDHLFELLTTLWVTVALVLLAITGRAWLRVRKAICRAAPASPHIIDCARAIADKLGVGRAFRIVVLDNLGSPFVTGVVTPTIVLPHRVAQGDTLRLHAVLNHELSHARTHDPLWMTIIRVVSSILWFHPLVWRMGAAHSAACEQVCDSVAAVGIGSAESYSQTLAREALALIDARPAPGGVPMLRTAQIVQRLRRIQRGICASPLSRRSIATVLLCGATLTAVLGSIQFVIAQQDRPARFTPIPNDQVAPAKPTSTVTGTVTDERGQPLAGVPVHAQERGGEEHVQRSTTTDSAGRFVFEELKPDGYWSIWANDPRYAKEWEYERGVRTPVSEADLKIKLYDAHQMGGIVRNERGEPVAGAKVIVALEQLKGSPETVQGNLENDLRVDLSDEKGRFLFDRLRPGTVNLVLEREGYAQTRVRLIEVGKLDHQVTIEDGATLHGRATFNGKPARQYVQVDVMGVTTEHRSIGKWTTYTDEEGEFRVDHIPNLLSWAKNDWPILTVYVYDGDVRSAPYRVYQHERGKLPEVEIELLEQQPEVRVGRVPSPEEAEVGSVTVRLSAPPPPTVGDWAPSIHLESADERGRRYSEYETVRDEGLVRFSNVPAGKYRVEVWAGGSPVFSPQTLDLGAGEARTITLEKGPARLTGKIIGADGDVTQHRLYWYRVHTAADSVERGGAALHADGRYEIDGLTPGEYRLVFTGRDLLYRRFDVTVKGGENTFDLKLPLGRIEGRLVGVKYERPDNNRLGKIEVWPLNVTRLSGNDIAHVNADAEGRFVVNHLPVGRYIVSMPGPLTTELLRTKVRITPKTPEVQVELRRPADTGQIAGAIRGLDGLEPASSSGLTISLFNLEDYGYEFAAGRWIRLDRDQTTYRFQGVPEGRYGMHAYSSSIDGPHIWVPNIEVRKGLVNNLDIEIPPARKVKIHLDGRDRKPSRKIWSLRMPGGGSIPFGHIVGARADRSEAPESEFLLPLGDYVIEADFGNGVRIDKPVTVVAGDDVQEFTVTPP